MLFLLLRRVYRGRGVVLLPPPQGAIVKIRCGGVFLRK